MEIVAKKFSYDTNAISEKAFHEHIKLYNGYVDKVNAITKELKKGAEPNEANAVYSKYRGLKKGETFALDGVILHEAYFQIMTNKTTEPDKKTIELITKQFGSYENWLKDFIACGKAARGWCILSYDQRTESLRNILLDTHDDGVVCMAYPLIVMDVYEHACATCSAIEKIAA